MSEEAETLPEREMFHKGFFLRNAHFETLLIQTWN